MKSHLVAAGLLLAALLTGCSQSASDMQDAQNPQIGQDSEGMQASLPAAEEEPDVSATIYYITDHETVALSEVSNFMDDLTEMGYTLRTDALAALPMDANAVILNAPREDITAEELTMLDSYLDEGGRILLLMPADGREIRYKYLEQLLEEYCILMDYDIVSETAKANMLEGDPNHVQIAQINTPDSMSLSEEAGSYPIFMHNARSFHFVFGDNYSAIKQDAMLETMETAIGTPYGGTEDDPVTYEGEQLMTMLYSRNDQRQNSIILAVGSSDFLLDENYASDAASQMKLWIFASLEWFVTYQR